jgi:hypothetical protein
VINLTKIILNESKYEAQANSLESELKTKYGEFSPSVRMAEYSQDRQENDPLRGKGFGIVDFRVKQDIPKDLFDNIVLLLTNRGFEIQSSDNSFESDPGERDYYPKINFHFNLESGE